MKFALITICTVFIVTAGGYALPPASQWSAVVSVDSVMAAPGDHIAVPVRITGNDQSISSIFVPLTVESPYLTVDSVSFVGSLLGSGFSGLVYPTGSIGDSVKITYNPDIVSPIPTLSASSGILATLWISVSPSIGPGSVPIDSVYIDSLISDGGPPARYWEAVHATDTTGLGVLLPGFEPGKVTIDVALDVDDDKSDLLPSDFSLAQNYPNPFNPATTIEFSLPTAGKIRLAVYNVLGQEVAILADGYRPAGVHHVDFEAADKPSGIYFYRLEYAEGVQTKKMTLVK